MTRSLRDWILGNRQATKAISMIAMANLLGTALGIIGSLVQARFVPPGDLGFVRRYSIVAQYAVFLNLGLFSILEREYPVLMGQGREEQAHRSVAIVQSWCLLVSAIVGGALLLVVVIEGFHGRWREASAWFIQVVTVWAILYTGLLRYTFRTGEEFEQLAKGQFLSSIVGAAVIPVYWFFPFPALVLRSIVGQIALSVHRHLVRPVQVGWYLSRKELFTLIKRGMRLFTGNYLRYNFWLTVEIWLMLRFAGDTGVGLLVFSKMIVESSVQLSTAINQVYLPQLAQRFGETGSIRACVALGSKPTLVNLGIAVIVTATVWFLVSPAISYAFPRYVESVPIVRILVLQTFIVGISLPVHLITVSESYQIQLAAAVAGLSVFIGTACLLNSLGLQGTAVAWSTLIGQVVFALVCMMWLFCKTRSETPLTATERHAMWLQMSEEE